MAKFSFIWTEFRWKLFFFVGILVLIVPLVMTFITTNQMKKRLNEEFQKRGEALSKNLTLNAKYGVLVKDQTELQNLTDVIKQNDDFAYVVIYDINGNPLASSFRDGIAGLTSLTWDSTFVDHQNLTRSIQVGSVPVLEFIRQVEVEKNTGSSSFDDTFFFEDGFAEDSPPEESVSNSVETEVEGVVRLALSRQTLENDLLWARLSGLFFALVFALIGNVIAFIYSGYVVRPIQDLTRATRTVSEGDLEHRIENTSRDEIGDLARNFNEMADSLRDIIQQLRTIATQLTSSSVQILDTANNGASMAAQQAGSISETSATIQELAKTAEQISGTANMVFDRANASASSVKDGGESMEMVTQKMSDIKIKTDSTRQTIVDLGELSSRIGGMSQMIEEIADRTKLIAFNAAIEAAGAGEAGRRFGVVANEVRTLAGQTGSLTKDIDVLIEEIQQAVHNAVVASEASVQMADEGTSSLGSTRKAFRHIQEMINQTTRSAREITLATKQQETASHQVVDAMSELAESSQVAASGSQQTMTAASELNELAEQLKSIVDRFKVADRDDSTQT